MKTAFAAGRRVGRFELLRELGRGAQATVWLGHDERLDREVAIKLLDPAADDLQAWLHEARAVSRLAHPNIVPVFEADTVGAQPMLVFEFVDGGTLAESRRGKGPMPPREAVSLMVGVLDALATAHAQGIVHRDLKPANVMLHLPTGRARILDFGVARFDDGASTRTGMTLGTPSYMAPEQLAGAPASAAGDAYAIGIILFELLAGRRPHEGASLGALLRAVGSGEAARLADLRPDLDAAIVEAVDVLLQRDPDARTTDLQAHAARLQALAQARLVPAPAADVTSPTG